MAQPFAHPNAPEILVEHTRYVDDIVRGAVDAGLTVILIDRLSVVVRISDRMMVLVGTLILS